MDWLVAVEGGGTSFRVAICQVPSNNKASATPTILYRTQIDSSHDRPQETLQACAAFIHQHRPEGMGYLALGVATFGPVGVRMDDPATYGRILSSSPKKAWRNVDVLTPLKEACQGFRKECPPVAVLVETDVNAPALAEFERAKEQQQKKKRKSEKPITSLAYVTIGTGVGVGLVVNSLPVHGRLHPEGGHVPVQPLEGDTFVGYSWGKGGSIPFNGQNTVEGLTSSVALTERVAALQTGKTLERSVLCELPDSHPVWEHAVNAIANLCVTLLLTVSVEKIVLGGGVMQRKGLLAKIQKRTLELLNGYLPMPRERDMTQLIAKSEYGSDAGLVGCIHLAQRALKLASTEGVDREVRLKQEAFGLGMWSGIFVGTAITAFMAKFFMTQASRR